MLKGTANGLGLDSHNLSAPDSLTSSSYSKNFEAVEFREVHYNMPVLLFSFSDILH